MSESCCALERNKWMGRNECCWKEANCHWFPCCPSAPPDFSLPPRPSLPLPSPSSKPRRDCDTRKRTELENHASSGVLGELGLVDSGDLENGAAAQHLGHSDLDREWVRLGVCYGAALSRKPVGAEQREQVGRGGLRGCFRWGRGGERKRLEREWRVGVGGDGEIGVENLVEESGVGEARWVAEGERGTRI
ncbi:hypothetical protein TIFTF001_010085 [Ficus carica]|uniref:Uncharacterized protein n=1 Tax=Ficus carica TaxID=3494 RepID=A0AA88DHM0_FICCA|nr:hypothetical protein TIFTF001_010085 [Ficus carica]